jgi:hypothetical protein
MEAPERIAHLIFKHVKGVLTAGEDHELNHWRNKTPENDNLFQQLTDPHYIRKTLQELDYYKHTDWDVIGEKAPDLFTLKAMQLKWLKPAAVATLSLLAAVGIIYALNHPYNDDNGRFQPEPVRKQTEQKTAPSKTEPAARRS